MIKELTLSVFKIIAVTIVSVMLFGLIVGIPNGVGNTMETGGSRHWYSVFKEDLGESMIFLTKRTAGEYTENFGVTNRTNTAWDTVKFIDSAVLNNETLSETDMTAKKITDTSSGTLVVPDSLK